jgi:hypothetical protein
MSHLPLPPPWCQWPLAAALAGLIIAGGAPANAQLEKKLDKNVRQYLSIDKLPERVQPLIISAVDYYDDGEYPQSIAALNSILVGNGKDKPKRSLRAWANQWLALNHSALKDSITTVKKYVKLSIDADVEIWREYAEFTRMPQDLREIYQAYWDSLLAGFNRKRHSWRLGLGTISRIDYSYRTEILEILGGLGAPIVADLEGGVEFKQLLVYVRIQRMRKNIERLSGGFYFEFSVLDEDLGNDKVQFEPAISAGYVLGYTYKSGLEIGGSFEFARLLFADSTSSKLNFNQTAQIGNFSRLSYGNFEFYVRKWF